MLTKTALINRVNEIVNGEDYDFLRDYQGEKLVRNNNGTLITLNLVCLFNADSIIEAINDCEIQDDLEDMNEHIDSLESAIDNMTYHQEINKVIREAQKFAMGNPHKGEWHAGGAYTRDDFGNSCLSLRYEMGDGVINVA